ncbi:MAG: glycosyl hydrolase family 18 protein [Candidatus Limnocylindrales bacterium]
MNGIGRIALSIMLALSGVGAGGSTLAQGDPDPASARLAEQEVFGFLPYWELSRASSIDFDVLTTLAWFGVEAGRDGRLIREDADGEPTRGWAGWMSDEFAAVRDQARVAGVRVVLTVERFAWTTAGRRTTKRLLRDPEARRTLAGEIAEAVAEADAGGVNLDFEPLPQSVRGQFVRLVRAVRRSLDTVDPSLQLTFDLTPDVTSFPLRRLVADDAADAAVLMGYEYRTPGSRVAGSVAPLRVKGGLDVRGSVNLALEKAPPGRIILAMPWYGRAWSTRTDEPDSRTRGSKRYLDPSTAFYRVSAPRAAAAGREWDQQQGSAWSVYRSRACETCPLSWRQLWYDDVDSVLAKVGLARRKGLRGIGIWALGYDGEQPELWSALRYGLERPRDREAPFGTATVDAASILGEDGGVPLVSETVRLALEASDGAGSGLAFVRVSARGKQNRDGSLKRGTTFPAVSSLSISLPDAAAVDEVFVPDTAAGASPSPSTSAAASPSPSASAAASLASPPDPVPVRIRVQWRDIAGNWSTPITLRVAHRPEAQATSE